MEEFSFCTETSLQEEEIGGLGVNGGQVSKPYYIWGFRQSREQKLLGKITLLKKNLHNRWCKSIFWQFSPHIDSWPTSKAFLSCSWIKEGQGSEITSPKPLCNQNQTVHGLLGKSWSEILQAWSWTSSISIYFCNKLFFGINFADQLKFWNQHYTHLTHWFCESG